MQPLTTQEEEARRAAQAAGADPAALCWVRSPLRVCLLGAHVDHQGGTVLGTAIDRCVLLAFTPTADPEVTLCSHDFPGVVRFPVADPPADISPAWGRYAAGAALALRRREALAHGIRGGLAGGFPVGGLSSSAAVGVAYLLALEHANGLRVSAEENIELDRVIENEYVGLNNGILDQSMILLSRAGCLTEMDCATGAYTHLAPGAGMPEFRLAVVHSGVRQALVSTGYNQRVAECREAARLLLIAAGRPVPAVPRLCDVPAEVFAAYPHALPPELARRARHFFGEQQRVAAGREAWRQGDLAALGRLIAASGESSITCYECGTPALIDLVQILNQVPGVYGARFSGAGFRGACFALVAPDAGDAIAAALRREFEPRHPELVGQWRLDLCAPAGGAAVTTAEDRQPAP